MMRFEPIRWSQLSTREKILAVSVLLAGAYAFFIFFFRPRLVERQRLDIAKTSLQQEVTALSSALPSLMQKGSSLSSGKRGPKAPISDITLSAVLEEVSRLAQINDVRIMELKPNQIERREKFEVLPIQIKSRSRFRDLDEYLHSLEKLRRPVWVDHLKIESTAETSPDVVVEMTLLVYKKGGV